ncbi:MAG: TetR/AcrR family transcriptional regulator [Bacteroidia bacterium]
MRMRDESKEAAIRAQAIEMIVREGFDGLSMQKLAKAAGVSPATIYIYWKNKEDMLNQLFQSIQEHFSHRALEGFSTEMSLREGLWLQWKNRLGYIREFPMHYKFYEQFRHSPLIQKGNLSFSLFKDNMHQFKENAVARGEMAEIPNEVYWAMAYAPFYSMVNWEQSGNSKFQSTFHITPDILEKTFEMVMRAFCPPCPLPDHQSR